MTCPGQFDEKNRTCDSCIGGHECEKDKGMLLTEMAMGDAIDLDTERTYHRSDGSYHFTFDVEPVCLAQLAKVVAWLEEHNQNLLRKMPDKDLVLRWTDWQALKDSVKP